MKELISCLGQDWQSTRRVAEIAGIDTSDKSAMNTLARKLRKMEKDGRCESMVVLREGKRGNPAEKMWRLAE